MNLDRFFAPLAVRRLGVAVSGGVDSTALLVALVEWSERPFEVVALHVNHQLRAGQSEQDEEFVRALCESIAVPLHVARVDVDPERVRETGVENAAREARRSWLLEAARELELDAIATAHHLNDQAESVLLAMLRGGGARRLAGIRAVDLPWVRPLLDVRRDEIERFLMQRNITPQHDETNAQTRYLRNRIRHEILPMIQQLQPRVIEHMGEIARQLAEGEEELVLRQREWSGRWLREGDRELRLSIAGLKESPFLFRRVLLDQAFAIDPSSRELSAADLRRIGDHFLRDDSPLQITKNLRLVREGDELVLGRVGAPEPEALDFPVTIGSRISWPPLGVHVEVGAAEGERFTLPDERGELRLRTRRAGDRWQPPGSSSTKKLKDTFIERRIERTLRNRLPVLTWNEEIIWVASLGVSRPFLPCDGCSRIFAVRVLECD